MGLYVHRLLTRSLTRTCCNHLSKKLTCVFDNWWLKNSNGRNRRKCNDVRGIARQRRREEWKNEYGKEEISINTKACELNDVETNRSQ